MIVKKNFHMIQFSNFFINKKSLKIGLVNDVKCLGNNNDKEYTELRCNVLKSVKRYFYS